MHLILKTQAPPGLGQLYVGKPKAWISSPGLAHTSEIPWSLVPSVWAFVDRGWMGLENALGNCEL